MINIFFLTILIAVLFCFQPFISSGFVPSEIRVPLLLLFTFFTVVFSLKKKRVFYFVLFGGLILIFLFGVWLSNSPDNLSDIVFVTVLCFFTYCLYSFLKRTPLMVWMLVRFWLIFLLFVAISSIGLFVTYNFKLLPYTFSDVGYYKYYFNPIFGFVFVKGFGDVSLGRACNYMLEPSYLAFFLTTNFFLLDSMPFSAFTKKICKIIFFLGAFGALSTGSWITFGIVFGVSVMYWVVRKINFNERLARNIIWVILTVGFIALLTIPKERIVSFLGTSSFQDRDNRINQSLIILGTSGIKSILFGNSPGFVETNFAHGESNQFIKLLVEEGVIVTLLIIYFIIQCTKDNFKFMLSVLIFLNGVVILWTPLFCINLVLCRILSEKNENELIKT